MTGASKGDSSVNAQPQASARATGPARPIVFYDGGCPLCHREIAHYRRIDSAGKLHWVDAPSEPGTLDRHALSLEQAMAELHVLDGNGNWHRGVDAFLVIWQQLPAYRWLAKMVTALGLQPPLAFVYRHFAAWRYRQRCEAESCTTSKGTRRR
jgi:predicted DCC family thiol-disulfide oxidoreductase YuxK